MLVEIPPTMRQTVRDAMRDHPESNVSIVLQKDQAFMDELSSIADTSAAVVISSIYYAFKNVADSAVKLTVSDLYDEIKNDPDMTTGPPTSEVVASTDPCMVRQAMQHPRVLEYLESLTEIPELAELRSALSKHQVAYDTIGAAVVRLIGRMNHGSGRLLHANNFADFRLDLFWSLVGINYWIAVLHGQPYVCRLNFALKIITF